MDGPTAASAVPNGDGTIILDDVMYSTAASSGSMAASSCGNTSKGAGRGKGKGAGKGSTSNPPKRAQNTPEMQLVVVSYMVKSDNVIDDWCTATDHRKNVGMDKCLLTLIGYLEGEVCSDTSSIYKSPVPSKDVRGPFPPIPLPRSLRIGFWLAAGAEGLDPRLDHEAQNRARS